MEPAGEMASDETISTAASLDKDSHLQEEMHMSYRDLIAPALALAVLLGAAPQDKPKSVKDVMTAAHKGKDSMLSKITAGKGTEEDHKKLLELYEFMATQKAPQGDEASWKTKPNALVTAAQ